MCQWRIDFVGSKGRRGVYAPTVGHAVRCGNCCPHCMRSILIGGLIVLNAAASLAQAAPMSEPTRERVIAALEKLLITGEPRHTSHDEGQWLQAEVSAAVARGDADMTRLAQRAAIPLIAIALTPVSPRGVNPSVHIEMPSVLTLPMPGAYHANLFASVDGGELVPAGTVSISTGGSSLDWSRLDSAKTAGLHQIRLRAHITY